MKYKSMTLGNEDQPNFTVVEGRLSFRDFNKAVKKDRDFEGLKFDKEFIEYRWGRKTKTGIKWSDVNDMKAVLWTVGCW